jgi:hypothetical protein
VYSNPDDFCLASRTPDSQAKPKSDYKRCNNRRQEHENKMVSQFSVKKHPYEQDADGYKQTDSYKELRSLSSHLKKRHLAHLSLAFHANS